MRVMRVIRWPDGYRKIIWIPFSSVTPYGVSFAVLSSLYKTRNSGVLVEVGWRRHSNSPWDYKATRVTEFLIFSGSLLDKAYQELAINGRIITSHYLHG